MGEITILGSVNGGNASKSFTQNPDGTFSDVGYNVGRSFVWRTVDIANVYDVADAVRGLSGSEFIVAGQVQHPLDRKGSRCKKISAVQATCCSRTLTGSSNRAARRFANGA